MMATAMPVQEIISGAIRITTDAGMMSYPENDKVVTPPLSADERWQPELRASLERCVRPAMTALVADEHVGYLVMHLSKLAGTAGRVVAVEPTPDNLRLLRANLADTTNVEIIHAAGWASSGTLELSLSPSDAGDHRAVAGGGDSRVRGRVPALALDKGLAGADRLDMVRLDVQASKPEPNDGAMRHALWLACGANADCTERS